MKRPKNLPAIGLGVLPAGCLVAWFATRDPTGGHNVTKPPAANEASLIDQRLIHQDGAQAEEAS